MARLFLGDAALEVGQVRVVWVHELAPPKKSLLVTRSQAGLHVYWNLCKHLPVPLDAGSGRLARGEALVCLTHGARYRSSDGRCVEGPCEGESLEAVQFEVSEDGQLFALI